MENYEINKAIEDFKRRLEELDRALDIQKLKEDLAHDEGLMENSNFWNNIKESNKVLKEVKVLKYKIETYQELTGLLDDLQVYFDMFKEGENLDDEISNAIEGLEKKLSAFEIEMLLSGEYDRNDAIIEMHPGAGGTESQDWCSMLFRMYKRYAEKKGYGFEVLDYQDGEEAGIKSVSFIVHGELAYGYLRGERGIHRLIRISPFDSNSRRHTSFCAVNVIPKVDNDVNIEIKPEDVRIDVYRSSGAGGQSVNTTDSAIRITHLKTGIVVTCQNERSQIQNREKALEILKSKLYQLELEENNKKLKSVNKDAMENSFGSQIRSYVFHPYSMIKDHRTDYEEFNVEAVMDGDLDGFINAYLKSKYNE